MTQLKLDAVYHRYNKDFERLSDATITPKNIEYHRSLQEAGIDYQAVLKPRIHVAPGTSTCENCEG